MLAVGLLGMATTSFAINANAILQANSAPEMRGRVMAYWAVALLGTQPIGGPLFGLLSDQLGPRLAFGSAAIGIGAIGAIGLHAGAREAALPVMEASFE